MSWLHAEVYLQYFNRVGKQEADIYLCLKVKDE